MLGVVADSGNEFTRGSFKRYNNKLIATIQRIFYS